MSDRLIAFGGNGADGCYHDDLWSLTMSGGAFWSPIPTTGPTPGARTSGSLILDPVRRRLILFGGFVGAGSSSPASIQNDLWVFPLDGPPVWSQLIATGAPPVPRSAHAALYDPVRDRMVVFGGDAGGQTALADTWALSLSGTPAWTQLASCPAAQLYPRAVYDLVLDRMVVLTDRHFGGNNDVRALSFATGTWSLLPAGASPVMPGRDLASVVYDPDGNRLLAYGGLDGYIVNSDLWAYSLGATPGWSPLGSAAAPGPREQTPGVYDALRHRMVVAWGGSDRQAWALPLAPSGLWATVTSPEPAQPAARFRHNAMYDGPRRRMILTGGDGQPSSEVWALSLDDHPAFTPLTPTNSPGSLYRPLSGADIARNRLVLLPGDSQGEVWALSLADAAWTHIVPSPPTPHFWSPAVGAYDPLRDRLVVFGGSNTQCVGEICTTTYARETWVLDFAGTPAWHKVNTLGEPPPELLESAAIYDPNRDRMIVFGGNAVTAPSGATGRAWSLSMSGTPTWSVLAEPASPALVRAGHTAIYDPRRDRMVIYGGDYASQSQPWALDLATATWYAMASVSPPATPPANHTAVYDPVFDRMIVSEGWNGDVVSTHWALTWGAPDAGVTPPDGPAVQALSLRPRVNPNRGAIEMSFTLSEPGAARVTLFDAAGRRIESRLVAGVRSGRVVLASGSGLSPGLYLASIEQRGRRAATRIAVIR